MSPFVVALLRDQRLGDPSVIGGTAAVEDALVRDLAHDGALEPVLEVFLQIRRRAQQLGHHELGERARNGLRVRRRRGDQVDGERVADDRCFLQHEA